MSGQMTGRFVEATPNAVPHVQSPLLASRGVRHAFFTRLGGVSPAPFDALNFGYARSIDRPDGDDPANVAANRQRALGGWPPLRSVQQVHGNRCVGYDKGRFGSVAAASERPAEAGLTAPIGVFASQGASATTEADAVVLETGEGTAGVLTADCCPVLLADPKAGRVAAVHAGWRGTVAGVLEQAIAEMTRRGSLAADLVAAVGPCIGPEQFEVGEEVAEQFDPADVLRRDDWPRPHVDVPSAVERRLRTAGVSEIDVLRLCTHERADLFFSHRRDGGRTGRMLNVITAG